MKNGAADRPDGVGRALRQRREAAGLSLAELARRVHYSKGYLSKVETGVRRCSQALAAVCDEALGAEGELVALARVSDGGASAKSRRDAASPAGQVTMAYGMAFLAALDSAHHALREVARTEPAGSDRRPARAGRAVHDAEVYLARERLLVSGTVPLVTSGEEAFLRLVAVRDAIRAGANLESAEYHEVYHRFAEALWSFRMVMRAEFGQPPLIPELLNLADWSDRERCRDCPDN